MKIRVKVKVGAKKESVEQKDGLFVISVKEPPVEGRANEAVAAVLAKHLGIPKTRVRLVSGVRSKNKAFEA